LIHHANFTGQGVVITREGSNKTVFNNMLCLVNTTSDLIMVTGKLRSGSTFRSSVSTMLQHDEQTCLIKENNSPGKAPPSKSSFKDETLREGEVIL
jgi:hypothetical protein